MLLLRSLLFDLWLYGSMAVMGLIFAPAAVVSRQAALWAVRLYARLALSMLRRICGLNTEIRGRPPTGPALVASKHQSFLDVLALLTALDRPRFVMKRELVFMPIFGLYALRIGATPVDRSKGGSALRRMKRDAAKRQDVEQLVIFPQGTRLAPGAEAPYRRGVAALYTGGEAPCCPVAVDTGRFWGRNSLLRRPGVAVIEFLEPIPPGLKSRELMATLESRVENATNQLANSGAEVSEPATA